MQVCGMNFGEKLSDLVVTIDDSSNISSVLNSDISTNEKTETIHSSNMLSPINRCNVFNLRQAGQRFEVNIPPG